MTPKRLREALKRLSLTQVAFAEIIGVTDRQVRYWLAGTVKVPQPVAKLVRVMEQHDLIEFIRRA